VRVIDLTHYIYPEMPVYPGTEPPTFSTPCTIEKSGFTETKIALYSHTGTHIDAPADQLGIDHYFGQACMLNLKSVNKPTIDVTDVKPYEDLMREIDFVLLHTGWSEFWNKGGYFEGYPVLSPKARSQPEMRPVNW